jgi:hypothetical protein
MIGTCNTLLSVWWLVNPPPSVTYTEFSSNPLPLPHLTDVNSWNFIPSGGDIISTFVPSNVNLNNFLPTQSHPNNSVLLLLISLLVTPPFVAIVKSSNNCKSVILYNLPPDQTLSIIAQSCYILTILGSFVIVI